MTQVSTIYDAIYTRLATLLPNHKELRNPRAIEQNDTLYLAKGFSLNIGSVTNTNRFLACKLSIKRDMIITNTLQVYGTDRDVTLRKTTEKNLLEDQYLIIKDI